jgi:regulator of replication initiation timing
LRPIFVCAFSTIRDAFAGRRQPSFGIAVGVLQYFGMNKGDAKEIKDIINSALETHLGSVHEEISDLRTEVKKDLSELEERLTAKIDKVDAKLGAFENNEIDKRLQLEVRVICRAKASRRSRLSSSKKA